MKVIPSVSNVSKIDFDQKLINYYCVVRLRS